MEHLVSDVKNIKDSLRRMGRYIKGKSIIDNNANSIKDLDSVGKAVWEFLSAVYDSHWDSLYVDNSKISFRNKVKSKFNLQAPKALVNNKGKETVKPTYISPLPPPILAKTPKEVNEISKFFKKNDNPQKKLYAQASSKPQNSNTTMNTLKIKEMFLKLQNHKIDQVQKINDSKSKSKPYINMTTKGPSCKQIIVPINKKAAYTYIKNANSHISSINHKSSFPLIMLFLPPIYRKSRNASRIHSLTMIVEILFLNEQSNTCILPEDIEKILKNNHIFNDIILAFRPRVIKVLLKSDMAII
ncbi:hypothetical protein Ac2012v2_8333 [Leucoagaricus gongylophorus]